MATGHDTFKRWGRWTIEIKVWKIFAALIILPILVLWFKVVHQDDEILALVRNEVVVGPAGGRVWAGRFVNTNERTLRDVIVQVDFLDSQDHAIGNDKVEAAELTSGMQLDLLAPLPLDAVRLRIYSVQWRMGQKAVLLGPFREPWEFGYLMVDASRINPTVHESNSRARPEP